MHFIKTISLMPLFLLSPLASCTPSPTGLGPTSSAVAKPGLSKLFTGSLQLEKALKPIAIPGGARLGKTISPTFEFKGMKVLIKDGDTVEPVAPNGTISGSGFTWTVTGGTAFPVFYEGMKIERPDIIVYGNTDKNGSFFATLQGVGSPVDQYVRIEVDVGPPYASLNESFILGEILRGSDGTSVTVNAYLLGKAPK